MVNSTMSRGRPVTIGVPEGSAFNIFTNDRLLLFNRDDEIECTLSKIANDTKLNSAVNKQKKGMSSRGTLINSKSGLLRTL